MKWPLLGILIFAACLADPLPPEVHASIAFIVHSPDPDTLLAWRRHTTDTVRVTNGDSVCVTFWATSMRTSYWTYRTRYYPPRDLVWRWPSHDWPHLNVYVVGSSVTYVSQQQGCRAP